MQLHRNEHSTEQALLDLVKRPTVSRLIGKKKWSKESAVSKCSVRMAL